MKREGTKSGTERRGMKMENNVSAEKKNSQVIVVTSGKGGVGKTTTSANVGTGLANLGKKVCLIDTDIGLRNARLGFRQQEESHIMENIIFNELITRGYKVDVGVVTVSEKNENGNYVRKNLEVDFVCNLGYQRYYIQSALAIDDAEKKRQEEKSLFNIHDGFRKIIIVRNNIKKWMDDNGTLFLSLKEFLINPDSMKA